jgi:hypothetical protein
MQASPMRTRKVLVFVDESNVVSSVQTLGRKLDWLKLRDHLANADAGRELIEMVIYAGLPPPMPEWQSEREKKNKFLHWLRSNGFLVVTKDGSPGDGKHYKANVDVLMAIDAVELSIRDAARGRCSRDWRCRFCASRFATAAAWDSRGSGCYRSNAGHRIKGRSKRGDRSGSSV